MLWYKKAIEQDENTISLKYSFRIPNDPSGDSNQSSSSVVSQSFSIGPISSPHLKSDSSFIRPNDNAFPVIRNLSFSSRPQHKSRKGSFSWEGISTSKKSSERKKGRKKKEKSTRRKRETEKMIDEIEKSIKRDEEEERRRRMVYTKTTPNSDKEYFDAVMQNAIAFNRRLYEKFGIMPDGKLDTTRKSDQPINMSNGSQKSIKYPSNKSKSKSNYVSSPINTDWDLLTNSELNSVANSPYSLDNGSVDKYGHRRRDNECRDVHNPMADTPHPRRRRKKSDKGDIEKMFREWGLMKKDKVKEELEMPRPAQKTSSSVTLISEITLENDREKGGSNTCRPTPANTSPLPKKMVHTKITVQTKPDGNSEVVERSSRNVAMQPGSNHIHLKCQIDVVNSVSNSNESRASHSISSVSFAPTQYSYGK